MRLNATGSAIYGAGSPPQVHIDGTTPAALAGFTANSTQWLTDTLGIFQDYTGSPVLKTYNTSNTAVATVSSNGANSLAAGGGVWWAYLVQTRTNIPSLGPFPNYGVVIPVSAQTAEDGTSVLITNRSTGMGLTCYSSAGAVLWSAAPKLSGGPNVICRSGLCAYRDAQGWHLVTLATGAPVPLAVRTETINWAIPLRMSTGRDVIIERSERLTFRQATSTTGWVLQNPTINQFNPDAREISPGIVRVGWCSNAGESVTSLILMDVNVNAGTARRGTVSGGTIVWGAYATLPVEPLPATGAIDGGGGALTKELQGLYQQPLADQANNLRVTVPWYRWFTNVAKVLSAPIPAAAIQGVLSQQQGGTGNPDGVGAGDVDPAPSFGVISVAGQDDVLATVPTDTVTFTSTIGTITTDAVTKTVTFHVGAPYMPLTLGDEPPTFVTDGAGRLIMVAFTP